MRISHTWPDEVAHALMRAVSRLFSTPWWGTDRLSGAGVGMSACQYRDIVNVLYRAHGIQFYAVGR